MIKVLIADDHPVVRWGFRQMLELDPGIAVVGEVGNGNELLEQVDFLHPDVVLLDIRMPESNGLQLASALRDEHPELSVLIMTIFDDADYLYKALAAGVRGYLLKTVSRDRLIESIYAVYSGQRVIDPNMMHLVLDYFSEMQLEGNSRPPTITLSAEEQRLLQLLIEGDTIASIASKMHCSIATVGRRINQVCDKLGVDNRMQAVRKATLLGLV